MKSLSRNQCYQIMCDMQMLDNIVVHSIQVCRVATCLADHLTSKGIHLDGQQVQAAALLHDITKTRSFETQENHALTGGQVLTDLGYPEIANLVRQHVRLDNYSKRNNLSEVEIINYADKRVLHDRIVSLDERMNYILERYGHQPQDQQQIRMLLQKTRELEKRIFSYLPVAPDDLSRLLTCLDIASEISSYYKICPKRSTGSD